MGLPLREAREVFERDYLIAQISRFSGQYLADGGICRYGALGLASETEGAGGGIRPKRTRFHAFALGKLISFREFCSRNARLKAAPPPEALA